MSSTPSRTWLRLGAEAIVVVGSILLALALDEWRVGLADRGLERQYLERLRADLITNLRRVESLQDVGMRRIRDADVLYPLIARGEWATMDTAAAVLASYSVSGSSVPRWAEDTFEELRSTGRMALIQDASLRTELIRYHGELEFGNANFFERMSDEYREAVRGRLEPGLQWRIRSLSCDPPTAACEEAVQSPGLSEYVNWLEGNEGLARQLTRVILFWNRTVEEVVPEIETQTKSLLERIDGSTDHG